MKTTHSKNIIFLFISIMAITTSCVQGDLYEDLTEISNFTNIARRTKQYNDVGGPRIFGEWRSGECATYALFNIGGCNDYDNDNNRTYYMKLLCEAVSAGSTSRGDWYTRIYEPRVIQGGFYESELIEAASHLAPQRNLTSKGINNNSQEFWDRLGGDPSTAINSITGVVILHFGNHFGVLTGYETEHTEWKWFQKQTIVEQRFIYRDYHNPAQYLSLSDAITDGATIIF